jgi:hypothetical protein
MTEFVERRCAEAARSPDCRGLVRVAPPVTRRGGLVAGRCLPVKTNPVPESIRPQTIGQTS